LVNCATIGSWLVPALPSPDSAARHAAFQTTRHVIFQAASRRLLASSLFVPALAWGDDMPSVTPYRPSVSTPAALSAPGWLELETGGQFERGGEGTPRDSLPTTLKLAFTPDWGVRLNADAWVSQPGDDGARVRGMGDLGIVLKRRFAVDDAHAFGLEAGFTSPTGSQGLSAGHASQSLNGIYSADLGAYHTDLNLMGTRFAVVAHGVGRWQLLWAASLSRNLDERWGWLAELSGTQQHGLASTSQLLAGVTCNVSRRLAWDAGLARRLGSAGPNWTFFTGLTLLAGKLF
jgi:hypothetical protein